MVTTAINPSNFRQSTQLLLRYLMPLWLKVLGLALLLFSSIGLQLYIPQILRDFIDMARAGSEQAPLFNAALLFLGGALLGQLIYAGMSYLSVDVGWSAANALRADLADHCLRLDMSFHNSHLPGEMIERIDGDVTILSNFFSMFVLRVLGSVLLLAGVLVLTAREDWRLGLLQGGFTLATLLVVRALQGLGTPHFKAWRQAFSELVGFLEERLGGMEDLRANGAIPYVMRHFYRLNRATLLTLRKAMMLARVVIHTWETLSAVGVAAIFALAAYLLNANAITIGTIYLIFHYTELLAHNLLQITYQLEDLQRASAGIARVSALFYIQNKLDVDGYTEPPHPQADRAGDYYTSPKKLRTTSHTAKMGQSLSEELYPDTRVDAKGSDTETVPEAMAVEFQDVVFGYSSGQSVLNGISFALAPGTKLGVLGRTGSGKTTLTRLLFRFYVPAQGAIYVNQQDIRRVPLTTLRQSIGYVTQDVQLFHATVRDNLTFFNAQVADAAILQALQELGLWDWVAGLPQGLDSVLQAGGGGLSAGEAQLLALTRVLLADPGLIILDEASSRLDPATEQLLQRAIARLLENRTAIIIAHRLATVAQVDQILILENGGVGEYGAYQQLASNPTSQLYGLLQTNALA